MRGESEYQRIIDVVHRVSQIAAYTDLPTLLDRSLELFVELAHAEAGTLYLYDAQRDELVFHVVRGDASSQKLVGTRLPAGQGVAGAALRSDQPIFVSDVASDPRWNRSVGELARLTLRTMYCLPLSIDGRPIGVVQVFNLPPNAVDDDGEIALLRILASTMVSVIDKTRLLQEAERRERRQRALADIQARLTRTLERTELLKLIMNYARDLLEVEATSVWELIEDLETGERVLRSHVATGDRGEHVTGITVPFGQGIIGRVVASGEGILVDDVSQDSRHYQQVDQSSGFQTRSILCVPLQAPSIELGPERGRVESRIIGGAQALNKIGGPFTPDDVELFQSFANLAATVLQLSSLYNDTYDLMMGMIKALAGAVDARDRNNRQHSQRVSDFSVAIAEEMQLPSDEIYHVRIGSLLHDIGKIGIPDAILDKPGRLTDEELVEMRSHTTKGHDIMSQAELRRLLHTELPALLQHHERLDSRGYPHGIGEEEMTWIARIVAVADVFDALTSERPYKSAWDAEKAITYLLERSGTEFDERCVEALARARAKGSTKMRTQLERAHLETV
jgi:HD-GYP domain-containing protein (c-di-GMP phosphodiesterase class II)